MSFLVAYDHSIFSIQEHGGISRYFVELARHLLSESDFKTHIVAPVHVNHLLRNNPSLGQTGICIPKIRKTYRLLQLINNSLSGTLLNGLKPDIIHSTYYLSRYRVKEPHKKIITVFDMIHEKFPDGMDSFERTLPGIKKDVVKSADHVICISEQTRLDVMELMGIEKEKTSVIHLASSFTKTENNSLPVFEKPYFLYVGSREWPKNFRKCLQAFEAFNSLHPDVLLVCFGGGQFTREEQSFFSNLHFPEKQIRFLSGDDELLQCLYRNALALIYPSLYEGFGLPVLEAMTSGCPVICSDTSSMPEVAGQAAVYFSPTVVDEMAEAMNLIAMSSEKREELILRGFERAQQFSWEKCARQTADIYRQCLNNSK